MVKMQIFFHPDPICDNKLLGCLLQNKFFALNQKGFGGVWRVLGYDVLEIFCQKIKFAWLFSVCISLSLGLAITSPKISSKGCSG